MRGASVSEQSSSKRAVAYYRASTDRQEASIPQQREWAQRAARIGGIDAVAEFDDEGIPA
jgi:DNA invertase Pin-like site-specific DNA recombinase